MLDNIRCEDYELKLPDLTVAVMVKSYLRSMKPEDAKVTLDNIVFSHELGYKLDGKELARLIDDAKTAAMMDTAAWQAQEGEHLLERVILYLRNESFPIRDHASGICRVYYRLLAGSTVAFYRE